MAGHYRNTANNAREESIARADKIAEAGEVFTPAIVIDEMLASHREILDDFSKIILEPSAGDGNFLIKLYDRRLALAESFTEALKGLKNIYAVEIQQDNVLIARKRCINKVAEYFELNESDRASLTKLVNETILAGDYLKNTHCGLACPKACSSHESLSLPTYFDLVIGNPPYNPGKLYQQFIIKALAEAHEVSFVIPTAWKLSHSHSKFRAQVGPKLKEVKDLPWATFKIKLRTCIATFQNAGPSDDFLLNEKPAVLVQGKVCNSILAKAYKTWPQALNNFRSLESFPLSLGWKCNLERGRGVINALQSIAADSADFRLPNNTYTLYFPTAEQRLNYVSYSSSKLAAYLQSLTDSDTVSRSLPIPPLDKFPPEFYSNDEMLYSLLALSEEEKALVESFTLFISSKAKSFYDELEVNVRPDTIIGKHRQACSDCGSSSFHRKGCLFSTDKERDTRDRGL